MKIGLFREVFMRKSIPHVSNPLENSFSFSSFLLNMGKIMVIQVRGSGMACPRYRCLNLWLFLNRTTVLNKSYCQIKLVNESEFFINPDIN